MNSIPENKWRRFFRFDEKHQLTLKAVIGLIAIAVVATSLWLAMANMKGSDQLPREKYEALKAKHDSIGTEATQLRDDKEKLAARFNNDELRIAALEAEQSRLRALMSDRKASVAKALETTVTPEALAADRPVVAPPAPIAADSATRAAKKEQPKSAQGTIAEACCSRPKFSMAIRQLGQELWPDLEWKILPADHPLYTRQSHVALKQAPPLEGLTDAKGFTFFILSPQDVSCLWNQNLILNHENDFLLALNIYDYARHRQPIRPRLGQ